MEEKRKRFLTLKIVLVGLLALVAIVALAAVVILWPVVSNLKSEYTTARVIEDVRKYVETHDGDWPKSWSDIGEDRSEYSFVRFDVTSEQILADPDLIYGTIRPASGKYYTYPYSREGLEKLLETITERKKGKTNR